MTASLWRPVRTEQRGFWGWWWMCTNLDRPLGSVHERMKYRANYCTTSHTSEENATRHCAKLNRGTIARLRAIVDAPK